MDDVDFDDDASVESLLDNGVEASLTAALAALGVDPATLTREDLVGVAKAVAAHAPEEMEAIRQTGAPSDPVRFGGGVQYYEGMHGRIDASYDGGYTWTTVN